MLAAVLVGASVGVLMSSVCFLLVSTWTASDRLNHLLGELRAIRLAASDEARQSLLIRTGTRLLLSGIALLLVTSLLLLALLLPLYISRELAAHRNVYWVAVSVATTGIWWRWRLVRNRKIGESDQK
jgi:hypothetical protein